MAQLKDSLITGDLRVTGTIYGNVPLNNLVDADDLKAIEALSGTSGWLKKTAANTWALGTIASSDISNIDASKITSGTLPIARGGTGLIVNPSMLINLESTTAADVFQASPRPGIVGTLPIGYGGTGNTTGTATLATTTADTTSTLYPIGVTSGANTALKRNTSISFVGDTITAGSFVGALSGAAASADKLTSSVNLKVNLASTTDVSFDGSSSEENIPVSGVLPIGNGGTGTSTAPYQGGIIYASSANAYASSATGTAGQLLQSGGTGNPSWITATNENIANTVVKRDSSGNFAAGTITASLTGHASEDVALAGGTMTGPLILSGSPDRNSTTNQMQAATKEYVDQSFAANDAMMFKGTIGTGGTVTSLPNNHNAGDTYRVITAGTYAGHKCEVGDLLICITDGTTANNAHWAVAQTNVDGALYMGTNSLQNGNLLMADGTQGQVKSASLITGTMNGLTASYDSSSEKLIFATNSINVVTGIANATTSFTNANAEVY